MNKSQTEFEYIDSALRVAGWGIVEGSRIRKQFPITQGAFNRARKARIYFNDYNSKQQDFLNFVLEQYVRDGVEELDDSKLPKMLELKYNAIADSKRELGDIKTIRNTFISFQKHLYSEGVV